MINRTNILIAGIAGASLGTEIAKSLQLAGKYRIFGCDISDAAYGHFQSYFVNTFVADSSDYINSIVKICVDNNISFIIPGGEEPTVILSKAVDVLKARNIVLVSNSFEIVKTFSNKKETFNVLSQLGFAIPQTTELSSVDVIDTLKFPCVVKPYLGTGGSDSVFLVSNKDECRLYYEILSKIEKKTIAQEYIPLDEGEFTIGVLSLPDTSIVGSIALKRIFNSKLSVHYKSKLGLISSGYSQGYIGNFSEIRQQAEQIAKAVGSRGPLNIQARVKNGVLIPFEINPRFSASVYLRAMAGFNEIDCFLDNIIYGTKEFKFEVKEGYYLRGFEQVYSPSVKND